MLSGIFKFEELYECNIMGVAAVLKNLISYSFVGWAVNMTGAL